MERIGWKRQSNFNRQIEERMKGLKGRKTNKI